LITIREKPVEGLKGNTKSSQKAAIETVFYYCTNHASLDKGSFGHSMGVQCLMQPALIEI
jgi:hypothetical protein